MLRIPGSLLELFKDASNLEQITTAQNKLVKWLLENKVENLDCSGIVTIVGRQIPHIASAIAKSNVHTVNFSCNRLRTCGPQTAANLTVEHSKVHTVNFGINKLGDYAPQMAANLTGKHSKVHTVDFRFNELGMHGPQTAANLTGKHSKVHTVNFWGNKLGPYSAQTVANLTGEHSKVHTMDLRLNNLEDHLPQIVANLSGKFAKIIKTSGVTLTQQQLTNNALNLFLSLETDLNSLIARCAKVAYSNFINSAAPLAQKIMTVQHLPYMVKALLLHAGKLTFDDIVAGKMDDIVQRNVDELVKQYLKEKAKQSMGMPTPLFTARHTDDGENHKRRAQWENKASREIKHHKPLGKP